MSLYYKGKYLLSNKCPSYNNNCKNVVSPHAFVSQDHLWLQGARVWTTRQEFLRGTTLSSVQSLMWNFRWIVSICPSLVSDDTSGFRQCCINDLLNLYQTYWLHTHPTILTCREERGWTLKSLRETELIFFL